jgi:plasmid replication initiation protein
MITWNCKKEDGDFKRWVLLPAVKQINNDPAGAGFTVDMQPVKEGRAVHRVRFHVKKVDERLGTTPLPPTASLH